MRKCSVQRSVRTPISPPYFTTMRSKLVQGTKSITCENRVRPEYMAAPRLKNQNRVRSYRRNPNRVQVDTKKNAQETLMLQRYFTKSPSLNRTAVNRNTKSLSPISLLVRGHRSEIMFGMLVVGLCPDRVAV